MLPAHIGVGFGITDAYIAWTPAGCGLRFAWPWVSTSSWRFVVPQSLCRPLAESPPVKHPRLRPRGPFCRARRTGNILEFTHAYRVIPLREEWTLPEDARLWMGDSRGRWDGNTLIVETRSLDG